jgi:hypothetical protein
LNARAIAPTRVALKWKIENPGSFTNIRIFRATAATPRDFCLVASVAGGATGFVDRGLAPGNVYLYQLRTVQEGGALMPTPSNTASVSLRSANDSPPREPPAPKPPPAVTPVSESSQPHGPSGTRSVCSSMHGFCHRGTEPQR